MECFKRKKKYSLRHTDELHPAPAQKTKMKQIVDDKAMTSWFACNNSMA